MKPFVVVLAALVCLTKPSLAGPPYVTDDPLPTDEGHYEVYAFTGGMATIEDLSGQAQYAACRTKRPGTLPRLFTF